MTMTSLTRRGQEGNGGIEDEYQQEENANMGR
jgi:hypothetical protein